MTTPVGSFPADPLGLLDMAGNVSEWCADWYERYPGSEEEEKRYLKNGRYLSKLRVARGGSWDSLPHNLRCATRVGLHPVEKWEGFRCVR